MGYFTFTDASVKSPKLNRWKGYYKKDKIDYCGYIKVVCPDGSCYESESYSGYGGVGGHDVYDLVVDWNKTYLMDILEQRKEHVFYKPLKDIVEKYVKSGYDDMVTTEFVKKLVKDGKRAEYLISDWKRNIGIMLACEDEDNISLPFPLKVTKKRENVRYDELFPSRSTQ